MDEKTTLLTYTLIASLAHQTLLLEEGERVWKLYYAVILRRRILMHYVLTICHVFVVHSFVFKYKTTLHIPHGHQLLTCVVCGHAFGLVVTVLVYSANTVPPLTNILQLTPHSSSLSG